MPSQNFSGLGQISESKNSPRKKEYNKTFPDIAVLIRSIQLVEGNIDCFKKAQESCDRNDCAWKDYCLNPEYTFES